MVCSFWELGNNGQKPDDDCFLLFYSQDELVLTYSSQPFIELWATHSGALCNLESHQMLKGRDHLMGKAASCSVWHVFWAVLQSHIAFPKFLAMPLLQSKASTNFL